MSIYGEVWGYLNPDIGSQLASSHCHRAGWQCDEASVEAYADRVRYQYRDRCGELKGAPRGAKPARGGIKQMGHVKT